MDKMQKEQIRKKPFLICLAGMEPVLNPNTGQVNPQAAECLRQLGAVANLVLVTDTSPRLACAEWKTFELPYCMVVSTRRKSLMQIIADLLNMDYERKKVLMVGFGAEVLEAAQKKGVLFYPILPQQQSDCWTMLAQEAAHKLLHGTYEGEYQRALLARHHTALPK